MQTVTRRKATALYILSPIRSDNSNNITVNHMHKMYGQRNPWFVFVNVSVCVQLAAADTLP